MVVVSFMGFGNATYRRLKRADALPGCGSHNVPAGTRTGSCNTADN